MGDVYEIFDDGADEPIDRFEVRDVRKQTRFMVDNFFIDGFARILGPSCSMVYMSLVRHTNRQQKTWPSQNLIAEEVDITRQWVGRYLAILQYFNIIRSVRVGRRCTNRYYLIDEKYWRTDFEVMLEEIEAIYDPETKQKKVMSPQDSSAENGAMSPQVTSPLGHIRCLERTHHMLRKVTSNRKVKQSKDNQERTEGGKIVKKKRTVRKTVSLEQPKHSSRYEYVWDEEKKAMIERLKK